MKTKNGGYIGAKKTSNESKIRETYSILKKSLLIKFRTRSWIKSVYIQYLIQWFFIVLKQKKKQFIY